MITVRKWSEPVLHNVCTQYTEKIDGLSLENQSINWSTKRPKPIPHFPWTQCSPHQRRRYLNSEPCQPIRRRWLRRLVHHPRSARWWSVQQATANHSGCSVTCLEHRSPVHCPNYPSPSCCMSLCRDFWCPVLRRSSVRLVHAPPPFAPNVEIKILHQSFNQSFNPSTQQSIDMIVFERQRLN